MKLETDLMKLVKGHPNVIELYETFEDKCVGVESAAAGRRKQTAAAAPPQVEFLHGDGEGVGQGADGPHREALALQRARGGKLLPHDGFRDQALPR
jgi:hypothetical protein